MELAPILFEHKEGADETDSLHAASLEHKIRLHDQPCLLA